MDEESEDFVHGKLILTGNTFERPRLNEHSIWLEYLEHAQIEDNRFDAPYKVNMNVVGCVAEKNNIC